MEVSFKFREIVLKYMDLFHTFEMNVLEKTSVLCMAALKEWCDWDHVPRGMEMELQNNSHQISKAARRKLPVCFSLEIMKG